MESGINWDLISKYLAGECSAEEEEEILQLMKEDPSFADVMTSAKSIWNALNFQKIDDHRKNLDLEDEFRESLQRIRQRDDLHFYKLSNAWDKQNEIGDTPSELIIPVRHISRRSNVAQVSRFWPHMAQLAAIILLAFMGGLLINHIFYVENEEIATNETIDRVINTHTGQMANVNLTDGSKVKVGAQSKILFSESRSKANSEENWDFFMEGLVHFNLISNANKSFVIHTQHAIIRVLGTEFSVKAYPDDDYVQIIVASGKVSVKADRDISPSQITLLQDEMGLLNLKTGEVSKRNVDPERYLGWLNGRLKFHDITLSEVSRELQRWFDVQIIIEDESLANKRIAAVVDNRSLYDVLNVIAIILDASYVVNDDENTVTLLPS